MSEIHYACPGCRNTLTVPARAGGKTLPCPICDQKAVVPVSLLELDREPPGAQTMEVIDSRTLATLVGEGRNLARCSDGNKKTHRKRSRKNPHAPPLWFTFLVVVIIFGVMLLTFGVLYWFGPQILADICRSLPGT